MDQFDQRVEAAYPAALDEQPRSHRGLPPSTRAQVLRYLLLAWHPDNIAVECGVSLQTIYNIQNNLVRYGSTGKPQYQLLGRPSKLTVADKQALFDWLLREGWRHQNEMVSWLWYECDILVNQSGISHVLKYNGWTQKVLHCISLNHSKKLHQAYCGGAATGRESNVALRNCVHLWLCIYGAGFGKK